MKEKIENFVDILVKLISDTIQKATDKPTESDINAINSLSATLCKLIIFI